MAVLQMQRVSICALKRDRKAILEKLQSIGLMEANQIVEDETFEKMDTKNARQSFEKRAQLADQALLVLDEYLPEKKSLLAGLQGKQLLEGSRFRKVIDDRSAVTAQANQLLALNKEIVECRANILKIENQIESLTPWNLLDVPMNLKGTKTTSMLLGMMPPEFELQDVYDAVAKHAPETEAIDIHMISRDKDASYLAVICLKSQEAAVEAALRAEGFARPSQLADRTPEEVMSQLRSQIESLEKQIEDLEKQIRELSGSREDLRILSDYYRVRAEKYEVLGTLPQSQNTFVISGYVAKRSVSVIQKKIGEKYDCVVDVEDVREDEEAPVLLKNNGFSSSVEGVLAAFGLPGKGDMDPTFFTSIFYVFLFGLMLSDAAYGLIVALVCGTVLLKCPRMGANMKKSIQLFFWCGISTLVWGILFGGYFGDLVDVVSETFFGKKVTIPAVWFVPLNEPMRMLLYSMLFGVIHLFTGLALKGYICLRDKKYVDFVCDCVLWFLLLAGLIGVLLPTDLFAGIAGQKIVFPAVVSAGAKWCAIIGALGILLMSGRSSKNVGVRIALGAYDLYNITGWLSDVLSYSRLLALGLATGVIASVVNQMASMGGRSVLGAIIFILVFLIGHTFNIGINLLGAYVHTCRLQYVEFFGKFYEGGGREFNPFHLKTKYVDIKEEE